MPQSLARVVVHIIFSTKHRQPWLKDANVRAELYAYMATVLSENVDSPARAAPLGLVDGQSVNLGTQGCAGVPTAPWAGIGSPLRGWRRRRQGPYITSRGTGISVPPKNALLGIQPSRKPSGVRNSKTPWNPLPPRPSRQAACQAAARG